MIFVETSYPRRLFFCVVVCGTVVLRCVYKKIKTGVCPPSLPIVIVFRFYASIVAYVAFSSMNSRRGATSSPINIENV